MTSFDAVTDYDRRKVCRAFGHLYKTTNSGMTDGHAFLTETCQVCGVVRHSVIEPHTGATLKREYTYPKGYIQNKD
jgi:hypothetical protein